MADRHSPKTGSRSLARRAAASPTPGIPPRAERRQIIADVVAKVQAAGETIRTQFMFVGDALFEARFNRDDEAALSVNLDTDVFFGELATAIEALDLGFNRPRLSVLTRIVALNHRLESQYWDRLDDGRKEVLLPLKTDEDRIAGAKFAFQIQPTQAVLRAWVADRLKKVGAERQDRGITFGRVSLNLDHLARVPGEKSIARIERGLRKAKPKVRRELRAKVNAARAALDALDTLLDGLGD